MTPVASTTSPINAVCITRNFFMKSAEGTIFHLTV
jgi:hypothetical protein